MSWLYTIVFVGMLFSNANETHVRVENAPANVNTAEVAATTRQQETERFEKTYPLNSNGRVSVSNINGSITVTAWDRSEVALVAVKTADTKEQLSDVEIKIDSRPDYLRIETDYGDWKDKTGSYGWKSNGRLNVDYDLKVPRGAVLSQVETVNGSVTVSDFTNVTKVSAVNGTVRASNLRGTADLSTVNGEVAADFEKLEPGSKINLDTVNGKVSLVIPSDANATVKADSLNGSIANDFGLPNRRGKYIGNSLHGRLGSGEATIKLESVNGPLSIKRRSDGKQLSPATDLLSPKGSDEEDLDADTADVSSKIAKTNREVNRAVTAAQRRAMADTRRELAKIKPEIEKINAEALKDIQISIDSAKLTEKIQKSIADQAAAIADLRAANFLMGVPRMEVKSDTFAVKGTPKVTIDAKGCSVRVRGWERQEVQYSISQIRSGNLGPNATVSETHTESTVNIKVSDGDTTGLAGGLLDAGSLRRIEIYVPKKTDLRIISNGEIRLEGVSGNIEVAGGDEPVNVRDSGGKLDLTNADGRVRVIGFDGEVTTKTGDGDIYLEGKFSKLTGKANAGNFTVTLPSGANADLSVTGDVDADGVDLAETGRNKWRLGSGGAGYTFDVGEGRVVIRSMAALQR